MRYSWRRHLPIILLLLGISAYVIYFSLFTILRYHKLYAHYFDLGIMHHAVYNTYQGLATGDLSRILEMTDPHASLDQVKRMSVHNDVFLAFLAPFYFVHEGPETILVIQALIVGLGAYFVYRIAQIVFQTSKHPHWIALAFSMSYLLYPPLQKAVNFDFHAVTLSTTFLLGMYYAWMRKRYWLSILFIFLTLSTKEQIGLVPAMFGIFVIIKELTGFNWSFVKKGDLVHHLITQWKKAHKPELIFGITAVVSGIVWVFVSMLWIIPYFRGTEHFGAEYYTYLKEDPLQIFSVLFRYETLHYVFILLAPVGLLAVLSPQYLLIASSEFATNILSANANMRNIYFHYDTALTAFVFIASIYGGKKVLEGWKLGVGNWSFEIGSWDKQLKKYHLSSELILIFYLLLFTFIYSIYLSPLPWGHHRDTYAWTAQPAKIEDVQFWKRYLKDDQISVSTSGHLAPHFTSRRYYYDLAGGYGDADFVIVDAAAIRQGFQSTESTANYEALQNDWRYIKIYDNNDIKVYKNMSNLIITTTAYE